jgi:tight adherence protein C
MLSDLAKNTDLIAACMAAVSVFSACLLVSWPYLVTDALTARMNQVAEEREALRIRQRANLDGGPSLRTEPKKVFKDIFDFLNLAKQADDSQLVLNLRMAGYRGHGPVVTFVAVRLIAPFAILAVAGFYVFIFLNLQFSFFVKLAIVMAAAYLGYYLPTLYVKNRITKRQKSIRQAWPDALDLSLICVESGMGIESAFKKVADEIGDQSVALAEELSLTIAELSYLPDRHKAYENLAERTGLEGVKAVVSSLMQAEKYGTPIGQTLRVMAQENRDMRMSEAEKKAAALPPKLTVPMILFFLPVLFAVIITPAVIQIINVRAQ